MLLPHKTDLPLLEAWGFPGLLVPSCSRLPAGQPPGHSARALASVAVPRLTAVAEPASPDDLFLPARVSSTGGLHWWVRESWCGQERPQVLLGGGVGGSRFLFEHYETY